MAACAEPATLRNAIGRHAGRRISSQVRTSAAAALLALGGAASLPGCASLPLPDSDPSAAGAGPGTGDGVVNVFDQTPQFGIYTDADPQDYTPPAGVLMWNHGTEFVTKLSGKQQRQLGSDLAVRVTYFAQCDEYDRLGGLFFLLEPKDSVPQPGDPRIELVRFITPFSDYEQGELATHVYPDSDISAYAQVLADPSHDVWIGIAGGSNPHAGDACVDEDGSLRAGVTAAFASVGFKYSVDLISTQPLEHASAVAFNALSKTDETEVPIAGTITIDEEIAGRMTVIVSGHGSAAGGDEYRYTHDRVILNGEEIGSFSTETDCAEFAVYSPRGNPGIFTGNQLLNPRNWCPGALVPAHTFEATLTPGDNVVSLDIEPALVPEGSYYATSLTFSSP
jgi:hypothetical protein